MPHQFPGPAMSSRKASLVILCVYPSFKLYLIYHTHQCFRPEGFLESAFIAPVAQKYLKYATNSVLLPSLDGDYPLKGLYAMILLSVHCFFFDDFDFVLIINDSIRLNEHSPLIYRVDMLNLLCFPMITTGNHCKFSWKTLIM